MSANGSLSVENAIESVTLFTKFESGFHSISSDGQDRTAFVSGYHQAPRGLKWVFDVSLSPQKARYTFAKYDEVRAAAPSLGGRAAGVVGVRFSLQAVQIFDVHSFAKMFAAAFDASCEKAPAFPFKRTDGITYPAASSFDANDVNASHEWITLCLAASAVEFTPLPKTSHNGELHEVQTSEDPIAAGKTLLRYSGVRIADREPATVLAAPPIGPSPTLPLPPAAISPATPANSPNTKPNVAQLGQVRENPFAAFLGNRAWLPGAIAGTLLGGAGLALALWQQSRMEAQLSSISAAMSVVQNKLTELDTKLKAAPVTASPAAAAPPPPTTPPVGVTQQNKLDGSDGPAGGAGQIGTPSRKTQTERKAEQLEKKRREKDEKVGAEKPVKGATVKQPVQPASAAKTGSAAGKGSAGAPTTATEPAAAPSANPPAPVGTDPPAAVAPKPRSSTVNDVSL